jgi:hypothetical protein
LKNTYAFSLIVMNDITTVGWVKEPQGRGTLGLVWSCLATIFICTWSALHSNIPARNAKTLDRMARQAGYVVMGLFAPEWLTLHALFDFDQAMKVKRRVGPYS